MAVVFLVALFLGWKAHQARGQREVVAAIKKHRGSILYDWSGPPSPSKSDRTPPGPAWLRGAIGDEYFQDVVYVNLMFGSPELGEVTPGLKALGALRHIDLPIDGSQATDATCADLSACRSLEVLTLSGRSVTDAGTERLSGLGRLRSLRVSEASLGDRSLELLSGLPSLRELSLHGNKFTEGGLAHVSRMSGLNRLSLDGGPAVLTEVGIAHLQGLEHLETLMVPDSVITDGGAKALALLPALRSLYVGKDSLSTHARAELLAARPGLSIFP
jgi:Leucine-rich repeat (LRR) protein